MEENSIIFSNEKNDIVRINELKVNNFRNYRYLNLAISDKQIVLTGRNGSGKTNLIEAISLLTAGKGLRRAKREELNQEKGGNISCVGPLPFKKPSSITIIRSHLSTVVRR